MEVKKDTSEGESVKFEVEYNGDGCDRLSVLPDALLIKILSDLPISQAILSSHLSTRWKSLWMYILKVDFGFNDSDQYIEKVLQKHKGGKIEVISLYRAYKKKEDQKIDLFISFAVAHGVEKLTLYLSNNERADGVRLNALYKLPEQFFLCKTLVDLEVCSCNLSPPPLIQLTCLKRCSFLQCEMSAGTLQIFTSGCPVIENLKLINCNSCSNFDIVIRSPTLLYLEIFDDLPRKRETVIDAPYVKSLVISLRLKGNDSFEVRNLLSVTEATLNIEGALSCGDSARTVLAELINSLGHAKHLHLNNDCIKVLTMLELEGKKRPSIKSPRIEVETELVMFDVPGLAFLFKDCPHVENLKITLVTERIAYMNFEMWLMSGMDVEDESIFRRGLEIKDMPKSLSNVTEKKYWPIMENSCATILHDLKMVEICGFYEASYLPKKFSEHVEAKERILEFIWREIKLVRVLLDKLVSLERLVIKMHRGGINGGRDTPLRRKLLSLPEASQKLVFA